jgi:hypothetical protein
LSVLSYAIFQRSLIGRDDNGHQISAKYEPDWRIEWIGALSVKARTKRSLNNSITRRQDGELLFLFVTGAVGRCKSADCPPPGRAIKGASKT